MKTRFRQFAPALMLAAAGFAFGLPVAAATFTANFNSVVLPPNTAVVSNAVVTAIGGVGNGGVLRLTSAFANQFGSWLINDFSGGAPVYSFDAAFKVQLGGTTGTPADGFSFNWATNLPAALNEEGAGTGLTVSFDTFDNGGGEAPAIDIKWQSNTIAHSSVPFNFSAATNAFVPVQVTLTNGAVTVRFNGAIVHTNIVLPGFMALTGAKFGLGARTGLFFERHYVDDVSIATAVGQPPVFAARDVSFAIASSPGVGVNPRSVTSADVNGDGWPDLISANASANTLTVLTNNRSGGFAVASTPGVGGEPFSVTAADVNGDGWPDLISANFNAHTLTVLTNNGSGGFAVASSPGVGNSPHSVTAADVNGDGWADLISANQNANALTVLTNNGSGGFAVASSPGVGVTPISVTSADVNGDGWLDLISANHLANTLTVLTNNGGGGFAIASSPGVGGGPFSVTSADVNGDGWPDLISANNDNNTLTVLTNNRSGGFAIASSPGVGSFPRSVTSADVNGDGWADLISANVNANTLTVLTNNGSGGFAVASTPGVGSQPWSVTAADVNGDGRPDLISANFSANTLTVLFNTSQPADHATFAAGGANMFTMSATGFPKPVVSMSGALPGGITFNNGIVSGSSTAVCIYNLIFTASNSVGVVTQNFTLTVNQAPVFAARDVSFATASSPGVGNFPQSVTSADVNGDGWPDLISANFSASTLTVLTNNRSGGFVTASSPGVGIWPTSVTSADVNGDGWPDLISANENANTLTVLTNNRSGGFAVASSPGVGNAPISVTSADINGDGWPDLISANQLANTLTVLTNNGSGGFAIASSPGAGSSPNSVTSADVNGDGWPDLISANAGGNTLTVLTNNGSGSFAVASSPGVGSAPISVTSADVNGDGWPDLISANNGGNTLTVLTNNGSGGFALASSPGVGSQPWSVTTADVNGDGWPDLISANLGDNTLTVLTNNGSGGFAVASSPGVGSLPRSVTSADVNGDGWPDLISANSGGNTLTVLTNNRSGGFALASSPGVGVSPRSVISADVNGDGRPDLISANFGNDTLTVLFNTSQPADHATFAVGGANSFTIAATGFPTPVVRVGGALPGGVTFVNGILSGTPTAVGIYNLIFTATNIAGVATQNFTLTVNQAPVITSADNTAFAEGYAGSFTATATGFPAPAWSAAGALPGGVVFSTNGVLSGTPLSGSGGIYNLIFTAASAAGTNAQNFTLTVTTNHAPVFEAITNRAAAPNVAVVIPLFASDPDGDGVVFSLDPGAPAGATVKSNNFIWTPTTAQALTTNVITIRATDDGLPPLSATRTFTVTVGNYLSLQIGRTNVEAGEVATVPVTLSTKGVTDVEFAVELAAGRFTQATLTQMPGAADSLQISYETSHAVIHLQMNPGQILTGTKHIADLHLTTAAVGSSAVVPLPISAVTASNGGEPVGYNDTGGQVIIIVDEPILEALLESGSRRLINYGHVGTSYRLLNTTSLTPPPDWQPAVDFLQTNRATLLNLTDTNAASFYRAQQLPP